MPLHWIARAVEDTEAAACMGNLSNLAIDRQDWIAALGSPSLADAQATLAEIESNGTAAP